MVRGFLVWSLAVKRYQAVLLIGLQKIIIHHLIELGIFGDPISAFGFNSTTIMPSFGFRLNNSAHFYKGLQIADKVHVRDVERNPLTPSPEDSKAEVITE